MTAPTWTGLRDARAITFDFDDTLWPIAPVIERAEAVLRDWFVTHTPRLAERYDTDGLRALRDRIGSANPHLAHDMTALRLQTIRVALDATGEPVERAQDAFDAFFEARNAITCYPEVPDALHRLADRFRLVGLTNGNARPAAGCGVDAIEHVIYAREVGQPKPEAAMFEHAAQYLDLPPDAIIHIGDHPIADVTGARGVGMHAVWLNRGGGAWPLTEPAPLSVPCLGTLADRLVA